MDGKKLILIGAAVGLLAIPFNQVLAAAINVNWNKKPVEIKAATVNQLLNRQTIKNNLAKVTKDYGEKVVFESWIKNIKLYSIGKVAKGKYVGKTLYLATEKITDGPAVRDNIYRLVFIPKPIVLSKNSDEWGLLSEVVDKDKETEIANLYTAKNIKIPNSQAELILQEQKYNNFIWYGDNKDSAVFKFDNKEVYRSKGGCYITKANDGTATRYAVKPAFIKSFDSGLNMLQPHKVEIAWNDGTKSTGEYASIVSGCGMDCMSYPKDIKAADIQKIGTAGKNTDLYELKDKNKKNSAGETVLDIYYNQYNYEGCEHCVNYYQYIKQHPLLYWIDPFGGIAEMVNSQYQPAVECGKPVIYLYPEQEQKISVAVSPTGGFKNTDPDYGAGWEVTAKPNGELINGDGQKYPYLFWEGYGLDYTRPSEGFVIKNSELESGLKELLIKQGLVEKEYKEFLEYWLPEMLKQNKAYYFVTFVPQAEFEKLAPLKINPKPETVIRVFMDWEGLDFPKSIKAQVIKTPARQGFTVVEWGGAKH